MYIISAIWDIFRGMYTIQSKYAANSSMVVSSSSGHGFNACWEQDDWKTCEFWFLAPLSCEASSDSMYVPSSLNFKKFSLGFLRYLDFFTICNRAFLNKGLVSECLDLEGQVLYTEVIVFNTGGDATRFGHGDTKHRFHISHNSSEGSRLQRKVS